MNLYKAPTLKDGEILEVFAGRSMLSFTVTDVGRDCRVASFGLHKDEIPALAAALDKYLKGV